MTTKASHAPDPRTIAKWLSDDASDYLEQATTGRYRSGFFYEAVVELEGLRLLERRVPTTLGRAVAEVIRGK